MGKFTFWLYWLSWPREEYFYLINLLNFTKFHNCKFTNKKTIVWFCLLKYVFILTLADSVNKQALRT